MELTEDQEAALRDAGRQLTVVPSRVRVLSTLLRSPPFGIKRLATSLGISRQALHLTITQLEARGLVEVARAGSQMRYARPGKVLQGYPAFAGDWPVPVVPPKRVRARPSKGQTRATRLVDALRRAGKSVFRARDAQALADEMGFQGPILHLLGLLVEKGALHRVKFGTYTFGHRIRAAGSPHPFAIGMALVQPSAVCALSALHFHGALKQQPLALWLATPREPRRWPTGLELQLEILSMRSHFYFGHAEHELDAFSRVTVFSPERAMLDLFAHPRRFGGFARALVVFDEALPHLNVEALVEAAIRYKVSTVAKRVGWALESRGVGQNRTAPLLKRCSPTFEQLNPGGASDGPHNRRWRAIE